MALLKKTFILLFLILFIPPVYAKDKLTKIEKFFDLDKNGWLSFYEAGLVKTHQRFQWPLADSDKKRAFDFNGDHMLGPYELKRYQEIKKDNQFVPVLKISKKSS